MSSRRKIAYLLFFALLFAFFGWVSLGNRDALLENAVNVTGTVVSVVEERDSSTNSWHYVVTAEYQKNGRTRSYTFDRSSSVNVGDKVDLLVEQREYGQPATHQSRNGTLSTSIFNFFIAFVLFVLAIHEMFFGNPKGRYHR